MTFAARQALIEELERVRDSRVVTYLTADRASHPQVPGFATQLDGSQYLYLVDQLRSIGHVPRLDLFLYTRGGATDSVWPLVALFREHTDHLSVLVPFRAHSGGTLICLGADEVLLSPLSELSPIDPTTGNQFNPQNPANAQERYGISVEDVISFFKLAEQRADLVDPASKLEVFKELTRAVHPLALGHVQRVYLQIRRLAVELLQMHLDSVADRDRIEAITKALTEQFFSHVHAIPRREAIPLMGDWVKAANDQEQAAMDALFDSYVEAIDLRTTFSLPDHMGTIPTRDLSAIGGYLETAQTSYVYETRLNIMQRPQLPPGVQVQLPPGAVLPLAPWVGRQYDFNVQASSWTPNTGGL